MTDSAPPPETLPLRLELPPYALLAIHLHAEHHGVPAEDYLRDLIVHGLHTNRLDVDPAYRCPTLAEVEGTMRDLRAEIARHEGNKTFARLHGAITVLARLAMAAGLAEYPEPAAPTRPHRHSHR